MLSLARRLRSFRSGTRGAVTVEYVLWMPVMAGLMMLVTDATMLMHTQTTLFDAARDASRSVALGRKSTDQAKADVLARFGQKATATVTKANGFVTSEVRLPFNSVLVFGSSFAGAGTLAGRVVMYVEAGT